MAGHAKKCVERYLWSWPTKRRSNSAKYLFHASMTPLQRRRNVMCWRIVTSMLPYCSKLFKLDTNWKTWYSMVSEWNLHDRSHNGPKLVTNAWVDWLNIFITHVNTDNIVMWVILLNSADWDCFKTRTPREFLKIGNPHLEEHCAFRKSYICSNKLDVQETNCCFATAQQNPKLSLWTLDWDYMGWLLWNYGI